MTPQVLILTGPPGAGKTTTAKLLCQRYASAVHLESDRFFRFIAAGYAEPWTRESHEQNTLVMQIVADAAAAYARGGYFTIVDGIVTPRWFLEPVRDTLTEAGVATALVVLRPSLDVCESRREWADRHVAEQMWNQFAGLGELERHVIDPGDRAPEQVAELVSARLANDS